MLLFPVGRAQSHGITDKAWIPERGEPKRLKCKKTTTKKCRKQRCPHTAPRPFSGHPKGAASFPRSTCRTRCNQHYSQLAASLQADSSFCVPIPNPSRNPPSQANTQCGQCKSSCETRKCCRMRCPRWMLGRCQTTTSGSKLDALALAHCCAAARERDVEVHGWHHLPAGEGGHRRSRANTPSRGWVVGKVVFLGIVHWYLWPVTREETKFREDLTEQIQAVQTPQKGRQGCVRSFWWQPVTGVAS